MILRLCETVSSPLRWATINVDVLAGLLRRTYTHPAEARELGLMARAHVVKRYDQKVVVRQAMRRLQEACERQAKGYLPRLMDKPHIHPQPEKVSDNSQVAKKVSWMSQWKPDKH